MSKKKAINQDFLELCKILDTIAEDWTTDPENTSDPTKLAETMRVISEKILIPVARVSTELIGGEIAKKYLLASKEITSGILDPQDEEDLLEWLGISRSGDCMFIDYTNLDTEDRFK